METISIIGSAGGVILSLDGHPPITFLRVADNYELSFWVKDDQGSNRSFTKRG